MQIALSRFRHIAVASMAILIAGSLRAQTGGDIDFHVMRKAPCSKPRLSDAQQEGLRGNVKSVVTAIYSAEMVTRGASPILKQTETAEYDKEGVLLGKEIRYPKSPNANKLIRTFDENRNVATEFFYNSDTSYYILTDYEYGINGRLATMTVNNYRTGIGSSVRVKKYDKAGNCIEETDDTRTRTSVYDGRGNCLQMVEVNDNAPDNNSITTYTYDDNCHRLNEAKAGRDTAFTIYQYQNDTLYGEERHQTGSQPTEISYRYDDHGNMAEMKSDTYGAGKSPGEHYTMTYVCEYDQEGNWTSRTILLSGAEFMKYERKIAYY